MVVSGVRTFVVDEEGLLSSLTACCCRLVEEVGISSELRRNIVFRRTEIAGSEKKCNN